MINITKGNSNTFIATLSERLVDYDLSAASGLTYYFKIVNELTQTEFNFSLVDSSPAYFRYNQFTLEEIDFNFTTGQYSYSGFADSSYTQLLETGMFIVSGGTNTTNSIYW